MRAWGRLGEVLLQGLLRGELYFAFAAEEGRRRLRTRSLQHTRHGSCLVSRVRPRRENEGRNQDTCLAAGTAAVLAGLGMAGTTEGAGGGRGGADQDLPPDDVVVTLETVALWSVGRQIEGQRA